MKSKLSMACHDISVLQLKPHCTDHCLSNVYWDASLWPFQHPLLVRCKAAQSISLITVLTATGKAGRDNETQSDRYIWKKYITMDGRWTNRDQITGHKIPPVYCQVVTQPPPSCQQELKTRKSMLATEGKAWVCNCQHNENQLKIVNLSAGFMSSAV